MSDCYKNLIAVIFNHTYMQSFLVFRWINKTIGIEFMQ